MSDAPAVPTVHERMAAVVRALSHIPKQTSQGVSYEFRGIDAVMGALHGPLADQGLYLSPRVLDDWEVNPIPGTNNRTQYQSLFRVCVDVYAEDGSMTTLGPGLAQSHDYGDKAVYQAQQNAIKYLLLEAFCIPTSEQDMDARNADPSPMVDLSQVNAAILEAQSLHIAGDYEGTLEWAAEAQQNADAAAAKLRKTIAAKRAELASQEGVDGDGPSPDEEEGAQPQGDPTRQPEGAGDPDEGPAPDGTPAWRLQAEAEGISDQQVLIGLNAKGTWPHNDQAAKPTRTEHLDAAADRHPELVASVIERLAQDARQKATA